MRRDLIGLGAFIVPTSHLLDGIALTAVFGFYLVCRKIKSGFAAINCVFEQIWAVFSVDFALAGEFTFNSLQHLDRKSVV